MKSRQVLCALLCVGLLSGCQKGSPAKTTSEPAGSTQTDSSISAGMTISTQGSADQTQLPSGTEPVERPTSTGSADTKTTVKPDTTAATTNRPTTTTQAAKTSVIGKHHYAIQVTKAPTCVAKGVQTYTCTQCGDTFTVEIPATGKHEYTAEIVKKATCTAAGTKKLTCKMCGKSYTEAIAAWGHRWALASCERPDTCTVCGQTQGKALGHNDNGSGKCKRCDKDVRIDMKTRLSEPTRFIATGGNTNIAFGWSVINKSGKVIEKFVITFQFKDSNGNDVVDLLSPIEVEKKILYRGGPIRPQDTIEITGTAGYRKSCRQIKVSNIAITYEDGTIETGWYDFTYQIRDIEQ